MNVPLTVGSLFAGIGGFDLGLERAGMRSVWQSEIDPYCQRVLAKHWPDVLRVPDVRDVGRDTVPHVDVICGGFPCQDISVAGRGAGIRGEKSGLWSEMFRVVDELRPRYLVVENVAALIGRGLDVVLADLAGIGFDAEWDCLRASDFGAPHARNRFWLVAYPGGEGRWEDTRGAHGDEDPHEGRAAQHDHVIDGDGQGCRARALADTSRNGRGQGRQGRPDSSRARQPESERTLQVSDADSKSPVGPPVAWAQRHPWPAEPDLPRMAHGIPNGLDRRRALGNALVPRIAEWIGRRIVSYEHDQARRAA